MEMLSKKHTVVSKLDEMITRVYMDLTLKYVQDAELLRSVAADGEALLRGVAERLNKLDPNSDRDIMVSDVNAPKIRNHDVVAELFGVSLKSYKDIDDFTKGIELGKYPVWSELTREKRKEVLDTIGDIWDGLVEESVTRANSSDLVMSKSSESVNPTFGNNMPSKVFSEDGLSIIVSQIETLTMGVPLIEGTGFTIETVTIECRLLLLLLPPNVATPTVEKKNDGFQTVGKKKKEKGKSKSTNGGQFSGQPVKQTVRYEPKATTSAPKKGTTNVGNASKSSTMLKTTITSTMNDNILVSNPYSALDEESEEEVENVYDESANLLQNKKTDGSSSTFTVAAG
ncbi:hypothetical protein Tco_0899670 [Tanacetum coccineum]